MAERAPLSVTFYLGEADAALFRALWPAHKGCRFDELSHRKLVDDGFLEIEPFNPGPNGECLDDVRLTKKGEREIVRLKNAADEEFKRRRMSTSTRQVPSSSEIERPSRSSAPIGGENPSGRPSRLEPQAKSHGLQAGPAHEEGA